MLAALVALLAAATAWLWRGPRRATALAAAAVMAVAALAPQMSVLAPAAFTPYRHFARPWLGIPPAHTAVAAGLPRAVVVLAACAAAAVIAAGAWRGRQGSLDALAVALPLVAAPAVVGGRLRGHGRCPLRFRGAGRIRRWAASPGRATLGDVTCLAWALAAPLPLAGAGHRRPWCAWRARLAVVRLLPGGVSLPSGCAFRRGPGS